MLVFPINGECVLSGTWTGITAARGFHKTILNPPIQATHYIRYTTGGTAALQIGETLTGGTSSATAKLIGYAVESGTAGSSDTGVIYIRILSGAFNSSGETVTGGTSTGTVATAQAPLPILTYDPPKAALITVETAAVNFTLDSINPTLTASTNFGSQIASGQSYVIVGWNNIKNFSCINSVASNGAILKYQLFV